MRVLVLAVVLVFLIGGKKMKKDPSVQECVRRMTSDAEGRFAFSAVPPGPYLLFTRVVWQAAVGTTVVPQGGWLYWRSRPAVRKKSYRNAKARRDTSGRHFDLVVPLAR